MHTISSLVGSDRVTSLHWKAAFKTRRRQHLVYITRAARFCHKIILNWQILRLWYDSLSVGMIIFPSQSSFYLQNELNSWCKNFFTIFFFFTSGEQDWLARASLQHHSTNYNAVRSHILPLSEKGSLLVFLVGLCLDCALYHYNDLISQFTPLCLFELSSMHCPANCLQGSCRDAHLLLNTLRDLDMNRFWISKMAEQMKAGCCVCSLEDARLHLNRNMIKLDISFHTHLNKSATQAAFLCLNPDWVWQSSNWAWNELDRRSVLLMSGPVLSLMRSM